MNYINALSQEEKKKLCETISGKMFKSIFKENEREFQKLKKGFRAKTFPEQSALAVAINNVDTPFISAQINSMVEIWLREIQDNILKLEADGLTHDSALATTLIDSVFEDNVELYLKLAEVTLREDAHFKLYEKIGAIKSERAMMVKVDAIKKDKEDEKTCLLGQIESSRQSVNAIKAEYEKKIQENEQKIGTLELMLVEAQSKITELQTAADDKADDTDYLLQFDDTNNSALPSADGEQVVCLCGIISDYNGQKRLYRYADLDNDGHYCIFHKYENGSVKLPNWYKITYNDGPTNIGFFGIWTWTPVVKEGDHSREFIQAHYNMDIDAIEIIIVSGVSSIDSFINRLIDGLEYQPHSRRVMFVFYVSQGQYTGILCNERDLTKVNGKTTIAENCIELPVYKITGGDILRLDNGLSFLRNAFAGIPNQIYKLKSSIDIVKNIVFSSLSWSAYKTAGITRAEYRTFKDFIGAIPIDDITHKIEVACRCTNSNAKELLNQFLKVVWKYVDGDSLEDEIILSAVSKNSELQERTKELLRDEWEAKNKKMIEEAQKELDLLDAKLKSANISLAEVQETFTKTQFEEKRLDSIISEKEKLAEDVETAVAERIKKARENAADFIANMAFVRGDSSLASDKTASIAKYQIVSESTDIRNLEANHCWNDVINTTVMELREAGVSDKYRCGLASFLSAAYIEKQPILLVGPNALDIVQAFSAAITGQKYGVLCCDGNYSNQAIAEIGADGEKIVVINNLLASGWINRLPELLSNKDIFYVATHPYAEDVQVEPKSLYGFMLPLFTEFFVDEKATGKYYGGYFAEDFAPNTELNGAHKELKVLSTLEVSPLVRNQINKIVTTMHGLYDKTSGDDEFLFAILPIAYASLQISELAELIDDQQKGITISANLRRVLRHILGDT